MVGRAVGTGGGEVEPKVSSLPERSYEWNPDQTVWVPGTPSPTKPDPKYLFIGFLSNVDESFLEVKTLAACRIRKLDPKLTYHLVSRVRPAEEFDTVKFLTHDTNCMVDRESPAYALTRGIKIKHEVTPPGQVPYTEILVEQFKLLKEIERLEAGLRIFHIGNVQVPFQTVVMVDGNQLSRVSFGWGAEHVARDPFAVSPSEVPSLRGFLSSFSLPLKPEFLGLAYGQLKSANVQPRDDMRLVFAWTGMELLFRRSRKNVGYQVSSHAATLLAPQGEERIRLQKGLKKLFELRSDILHDGESGRVKPEHAQTLVHLLQRCLRRCLELGLPKDDLLEGLEKGTVAPGPAGSTAS